MISQCLTSITVTQSSVKLSIWYAQETCRHQAEQQEWLIVCWKTGFYSFYRLRIYCSKWMLPALLTSSRPAQAANNKLKLLSKTYKNLKHGLLDPCTLHKLTETKLCEVSATFFLVINTDGGNGQATQHNWNRKPCRESRAITVFLHELRWTQQYTFCHWLINEHGGLFCAHVFWWRCTGRSVCVFSLVT